MRILAPLTFAGLLFVMTTLTALASHGPTTIPAPVPAHGSVWFGSGLDRYEAISTLVPAHGSVWFGSGLEHFDTLTVPVPVDGSGLEHSDTTLIIPVPVYGIALFGQGIGH